MKTHQFDPVSFISGLIVTAIGLLFLLPRDVGDIVEAFLDAGRWFWPVLLLAVGAAVIVTSLRSHQRRREGEDEI